jgi:branched-chain amino acid transport system substrate-binding protein
LLLGNITALRLAFLCLLAPQALAGELPTVRLGLVVPLASDAGPAATGMRYAADLAVAEWSGRLGHRVELVVKEDAFDPRQATLTAEQLRQEAVWGVVGHFHSSSSIAASAVYHAAGIPQVTAASTHPRLTAQGLDTVFRVCGRDDQQASVAAEFVLTRLRARRVAVAHDRTEYGRGLAEAFRQEVTRHPLARVVAQESLMQGDREFERHIAQIALARPEAIYFGGVFREAGHLVRHMRQAGIHAFFISGDAVFDPEFVALAGDAALGAYLTFEPDPRLSELTRPLLQQYESRYGSLTPYALQTYDAVGVLLRAIQVARPSDASQAELRKVARTIHERPYQGVLGTLRWDRNGDVAPAPYAVNVTKRDGSVRGWFEQVPLSLGAKGNAAR